MSNHVINKNNSVWIYFIIVFAISWLFWVPVMIFQENNLIKDFGEILFFIGITVPSLTGIFLTYILEGPEEMKSLLKRGLKIFGIFWLVLIIFLIPLLVIISLSLTSLLTDSIDLITNIPKGIGAFLMFPFIFLIGGPLFEEFGWRGFALDRLQLKWNSLISSIILGFFWGLWHLPAFFIMGTSQYILLEFIPIVAGLFFVQIILLTILITWIYNSTEKSILSVLLLHTMWNTTFGGFFMAILTEFANDPSTVSNNDMIINKINIANIILTFSLVIVCFIVIIKRSYNLGIKEAN